MIDMTLHRNYPEGNVLNCDNRLYSQKKVKITDIVLNNYDLLAL